MMPNNSRIAAVEKQIAAEMRPQILELRRMGYPIRKIAEKVAMSPTWVHKQLKAALNELKKQNDADAEAYKALQLDRYESMLMPLQKKILSGDTRAIDSARRILDSINRLTGIEAPTKIAATTPEGDAAASGIVVVPAVSGSVDEWLKEFGPKE